MGEHSGEAEMFFLRGQFCFSPGWRSSPCPVPLQGRSRLLVAPIFLWIFSLHSVGLLFLTSVFSFSAAKHLHQLTRPCCSAGIFLLPGLAVLVLSPRVTDGVDGLSFPHPCPSPPQGCCSRMSSRIPTSHPAVPRPSR